MSKEKKYISFDGVCAWACIHEPRLTYDAQQSGGRDSQYSILVECDEAKFKKLMKAGLPALTKLKDGPEGLEDKKFITLRASGVKTLKNGEVMTFTGPKVLDANQKPLDKNVGNGSTVKAICEVAPLKMGGIALRLKCVQVLDLVEYEATESGYSDLLAGKPTPSEEVPWDTDSVEDLLS